MKYKYFLSGLLNAAVLFSLVLLDIVSFLIIIVPIGLVFLHPLDNEEKFWKAAITNWVVYITVFIIGNIFLESFYISKLPVEVRGAVVFGIMLLGLGNFVGSAIGNFVGSLIAGVNERKSNV